MRTCCRCGRKIILCNGFTLARDIVSGRTPPREHCGVCVGQLEALSVNLRESYLKGIDD
jgi:hypothetical protein